MSQLAGKPAVALQHFHERALLGGAWRHEGGASLTTYFMGACLRVFPNEYRKYRASCKRWTQAHLYEARTVEPDDRPLVGPEAIVVGNARVWEDLRRTDERTRAIIALMIDGYTQDKIAELLQEPSVRAVEGVIYRWRSRYKHRKGGSDDEEF
ncbi:hypothetical protein [Nonomuraea sp. NEAU-A123]|uniref:hypothetical protein n=1 Tax=Nonomuraea sp. NEAU-A123 TaxID=2839649 RepID=UPI001BE427F6|nr:hypothetical protein [Nonomuraea sp. NEAU-A123]MBT2230047.1 hypothetical protein [Nonomuraea sp. NEAU-A123]MBT2230683.1 hypothetical protein [Nonomuraea sp. NEAU-A123]